MQKIFLLSCFLFLLTLTLKLNAQKIVSIENNKDVSKMKITILYDNYVFTEGTQADWGFACLIEDSQKTILFDTGAKGDILMHNVKTLNADLSKIDLIVISHNHWDHTGGWRGRAEPPAIDHRSGFVSIKRVSNLPLWEFRLVQRSPKLVL